MGVTSAGRCEMHELPLDARGECQLCRLGAIPSKPPPTRATSWIVTGIAVALLSGGLLVFRATSGSEREPPPRGVPVTATSANPAPNRAPTRPPPPRPRERLDRPSSVPLPPTPSDPAGTWRVQTAPEPPAPSQPPAEAQPTEDDARRALSEVQIEMYATSWCPSCRRARAYLDQNGIAYTEYDIDDDADAKARLSQINSRTSIPTFQIDDIVQVGFSPESFQQKLNEAVRRRLR